MLDIIRTGFPRADALDSAMRFLKWVIAFAAATAASFAAAEGGPVAGLPALIARASPSIVMIEAALPGGRVTRGAGFVANDRGGIATAFHVVAGAASILLRLSDGRAVTAKMTAGDEPFDIALLETDSPIGAPPLKITGAEPLPGDAVFAVGYPFGHAFSVTAGIVSGLDRSHDPMAPHGFLQHDAALNPGSSGGPLLDSRGGVIGINAAIPNGRRSDVGAGFAIPGGVAARVLNALERDGAIAHGRIGARLRMIDPALAAALGRGAGGAAIEEIERGGPADKAGARAGDLIFTIAGGPIDNLRRVSQAVSGGSPGETVRLTGSRGGIAVSLDIILAEAVTAREPVASTAAARPAPDFGLELEARRAVVQSIARLSPAAAAGLQKGDLIEAVGASPVTDAATARAALAAAGGQAALLVRREGAGARYLIISRKSASQPRSPFDGNREAEGSASF